MEFFGYILIAVLIFLGGFIIWLVYRMIIPTKDEDEYFEKQKERLEDDRVYDPETGKFYSLEELENGIQYNYAKSNELFSEEEIEKIYFDDKSFPLSHNYLLGQGYQVLLEAVQLKEFDKTAIANSYADYSIAHSYQISEKSTLSIIQLDSKLKGVYFGELYFVGTVQLSRSRGHFLLEPMSIKEGLFNLIDNAKSEIVDGWNLVSFEQEPEEIFVDDIVGALPKHKMINLQVVDDPEMVQVSVEVKEDKLYFKSVLPIDSEDIGGILSIIKNIEKI